MTYYSRQTLQARTEALLAENGPWDRVMRAKAGIEHLLFSNVFAPAGHPDAEQGPGGRAHDRFDFSRPNPELKPYRQDLHRAARQCLNDASGGAFLAVELGDKWINGPQMVVKFRRADFTDKLEKNARDLLDTFERVRQPEDREKAMAAGRPVGKKLLFDTTIEKRRETLALFVDEIEQWVMANQGAIPPVNQTALAENIQKYRQAYGEVLEYVDWVKHFVVQQDKRQAQSLLPKNTGPDMQKL